MDRQPCQQDPDPDPHIPAGAGPSSSTVSSGHRHLLNDSDQRTDGLEQVVIPGPSERPEGVREIDEGDSHASRLDASRFSVVQDQDRGLEELE